MQLEWRDDQDWEGDYRLFADGVDAGFVANKADGEITPSILGSSIDAEQINMEDARQILNVKLNAAEISGPVVADENLTSQLFDTGVRPDAKQHARNVKALEKQHQRDERRRKELLGEVTPLRTKILMGVIAVVAALVALGIVAYETGFVYLKEKESPRPAASVSYHPYAVTGNLAPNKDLDNSIQDLKNAINDTRGPLDDSNKYPENKGTADALNQQVSSCSKYLDRENNPFPSVAEVQNCTLQIQSKTFALKSANDQSKAKADASASPAPTSDSGDNSDNGGSQPQPTKTSQPAPTTQAPAPQPVPVPVPTTQAPVTKTYSISAGCLYGGSITFSSSGNLHITPGAGATLSGNTVSGSGAFSASATSDQPISVSRNPQCSS